MVSLMNTKFLATVILSLVVGAGLGYSISLPQIMTLQSSVLELETETSALTNDYSNLSTTYNQLRDNYGYLNETYNQVRDSYDYLNASYHELASELSTLTVDYNYLNENYVELLQQYEDLLFHYNLINGPASNFTTIQDLQITLAVHRTSYYYKDPVSGNVTITYLNGTVFEGSFILYIRHLTKETMSTTASILISGFTEFYLSPPVFGFGPGNYTIGISSLSTTDGYIIESRWQVFPSVQVEAK